MQGALVQGEQRNPRWPCLRPLNRDLEMHRTVWDCDDTRPAVREAFAEVVDCGTEAPTSSHPIERAA